jgi:hypothetical protein
MAPVKVYYFLAPDTVDDIIWPMIQLKLKLLGEFVEGSTSDTLVDEDNKYAVSVVDDKFLHDIESKSYSITVIVIECHL